MVETSEFQPRENPAKKKKDGASMKAHQGRHDLWLRSDVKGMEADTMFRLLSIHASYFSIKQRKLCSMGRN